MTRVRDARVASWALTVVTAWLATSAPAADAPRNLPVEAFGRLPFYSNVVIAPDGRHVAAAMRLPDGKQGIVIHDLDARDKKPVVISPEGWTVSWLRWKNDERLLISLHYPQRRSVTRATLETRLVALDADGGNMRVVLRPTKSEMDTADIVQTQDRVIDFLPDDPRRILLAFNPDNPRRRRPYKVDVYNSQRERVSGVEDERLYFQNWVLDRHGKIRIAQGRNPGGPVGAGYKTYGRDGDGADWVEIWDTAEQDAEFTPLLFDEKDPDLIYALSSHSEGTLGLYKFRMSTRQFVETLFHESTVDIDEVLYDARGTSIEGISYVTDAYHVVWFSRTMAAIDEDLQRALPGWSAHIVSAALGDRRLIVEAAASDHPGRFYIYEPAKKRLDFLVYANPALDSYRLARAEPVRYRSRDGLDIQGYLTLPTGDSTPPGVPLPAVVLPHDGPTARDYGSFDPLVQMFANRGYAVLQINFRGSLGYGREFRQAGQRAWGEEMQDDLTDGTHWLVEQKIADPKRICIAGGSYGGYAALMGVVKEPTLYRCAVSLSGFSDLTELVVERRRYVGGRNSAARQIGRAGADADKLAASSPAQRTADIRAAVLLLHGTADRVVPISHSRNMAEALKRAGKSHRYVELEDEDHWLTHEPTRLQAFREIDEFLARHLAP